MFRGNFEIMAALVIVGLAYIDMRAAIVFSPLVLLFLGLFKKIKRRGLRDEIREEQLEKMRHKTADRKNKEEIIEFIDSIGASSTEEIVRKMHLSLESATRLLNELEYDGKIEKIDTHPGTFAYRVRVHPKVSDPYS